MKMRIGTLSWSAARLVVLLGVSRVSTFDQFPLRPGKQPATTAGNPFTEEFSQFVQVGLQSWHVAGLAISIVDGNDTFAKGFGFATLPDVPATPETLWYVGSTTKAHTTASLATLIDSQNYSQLSLGWKTPISAIIRDDFVLQDEWATRHLTLEDAATHRTGLTRHDQSSIWNPENPRGIPKEAVRNLRNLPMLIEPRTEFHYCNQFYTVLGHVVETLTGKWLGQVMKERIWAPLGMHSTYFDLDDARAGPEHVSQGYMWHDDVEELKPIPYVQSAVINGAGAVISNVLDYAKWMRCLLNKDEPFSEAVHDEIRKSRMIADFESIGADLTAYSLSWFRVTTYGKTAYWHSGSTMTHGALVYWFPDDNYGITIFENSVTSLRNILMYKLIEDRFGVPKEQRINVEARERKQEKLLKEFRANATDRIYPDRPSTPVPPTLSLPEHTGTYEDAGYGSVRFYMGTHPSRPKALSLMAERPDRAWNETVRMEHVSGEYFIWYSYIKEGPVNEPELFSKAEFKLGPDGKISGLEVEVYDYEENMSQGTVLYKKVA